MTVFTPIRKVAALLFLGLSLCYLSLSPGTIEGEGYTREEIASGTTMLASAHAWATGTHAPPVQWSRHGPLPVLFDLPFDALGNWVVSPDFVLSFQPPLFTAALASLLFLWLRKLTSPRMSAFFTMTAAFGTMLWPYAYIGLETKQSFFVLLAAYLALSKGKGRGWSRVLCFAGVCGFAISLKSTGFVLAPTVAYLVYVVFREDWRGRRSQIAITVLVIAAMFLVSAVGRNLYWGPLGGGGLATIRPWLIHSPLDYFSNLIGMFGSPTKGLLVYAPVLLLALYVVPRTFYTHHELTLFAVLLTGSTVAFMSLFENPADEVWGSRYLHVAIAPLLLCLAAARRRWRLKRDVSIAVLCVMGVVISFLGAFYYYGLRDFAAAEAGQNTLEWLTGDSEWNAIEFNGRLFRVWLRHGTQPVLWTPKHIWVWSPPPDAPPWKTIDLRQFCSPQSMLLRFWHVPKHKAVLTIFTVYLASFILGPALLVIWIRRNVLATSNSS